MSQCRAKQYSDQMLCRCGLGWDMNDPDPPECPERRREREVRELHEKKQRTHGFLMNLKENIVNSLAKKTPELNILPQGAFPEFGIREGLYALHCGYLAMCLRTPPSHILSSPAGPDYNGQQRFYVILSRGGEPVFWLHVGASGADHWAYHAKPGSSSIADWNRGIPLELR